MNKGKFNRKNERIKYHYRIHIRRALHKDDKSINAALKHIRCYEEFTDFKGLETFNEMIADEYIQHMIHDDFSMSYVESNIKALKVFLIWLERQRGYRSKIDYNHIEYLNISNNQRKMAKATEYKKSYKYKQILKAIRLMPTATIIDKRNKAVVSLQALCGLRISELRTVKIKNLICEDGNYFIYVNPKDMAVKYAKTRHANFMPLPQDIVDNVINWKRYLVDCDFKDKDPMFPKIPKYFNQVNLLESKITNEEIKSSSSIITIFKKAFETAGYKYIRPHSFRHTIVRFSEKQTPEFLNAVRQSLGHSSIDTTMHSYGEISEYEQREKISGLQYDFDG